MASLNHGADITDAIAEHYIQQGYLVVKGFLPPSLLQDHLAFLETSLAREVWPIFNRLGLTPDDPELSKKVSHLIRENLLPDAEDEQLLLGHFPLTTRLADNIKPIAAHLGNSPLLKRILRSATLNMHMPPMFRYVLPGYTPAAVPPHQDISYNTHLPDFLTVWIPLVEITQECGGLVVYEGSQRAYTEVATAPNGWLEALDVSRFNGLQLIDLEPGDAVLLSPRIIHASAPNTSQRMRISMDLRIFATHAYSGKHYMTLDTLETFPPRVET